MPNEIMLAVFFVCSLLSFAIGCVRTRSSPEIFFAICRMCVCVCPALRSTFINFINRVDLKIYDHLSRCCLRCVVGGALVFFDTAPLSRTLLAIEWGVASNFQWSIWSNRTFVNYKQHPRAIFRSNRSKNSQFLLHRRGRVVPNWADSNAICRRTSTVWQTSPPIGHSISQLPPERPDQYLCDNQCGDRWEPFDTAANHSTSESE